MMLRDARALRRGCRRRRRLVELAQKLPNSRHARGVKPVDRARSMGTHTRPVFGCTQNGAFSKWLRCFDTSASSRGYVYCRMMSSFTAVRAACVYASALALYRR